MEFKLDLLLRKRLKRVDTKLNSPVIDFIISHIEGEQVQITFLSGDLAQTTWQLHKSHLHHKGAIFFSFNLDFARCINAIGMDK